MDNIIDLVLTVDMQGFVGLMDFSNQQYSVKFKPSILATPEENRQLENDLRQLYKAYLQKY